MATFVFHTKSTTREGMKSEFKAKLDAALLEDPDCCDPEGRYTILDNARRMIDQMFDSGKFTRH